jgi:Aerotolerance regulator N-terminal
VNLSLLLPSALAALAALLLPVFIHLSRRSEQKLTDFAALRWLDAKLRPRRKLVLQERLLLLLRLLLLIVLAFFLAQPVLLKQTQPAHWLLVVPGTSWQSVSGLPSGEQVQRHWLAVDFPAIASGAAPEAAASLSSLLRELDAKLPASTALTVVLPETLSGLDAERLRLSRKIDWRIVPGRMPERIPTPVTVPALAIRSEAAGKNGELYFRAAYSVWQNGLAPDKRQAIEVITSDEKSPATSALWLDLRNQPLTDTARRWVESGGSLMLGPGSVLPKQSQDVLWRDEQGNAVLISQSLGKGRLLQWQRTLDAQSLPLLEYGDFPQRLYRLVQAPMAQPDRALAGSLQPRLGAAHPPVAPQPLMPWFALAAVLLFMLERWLASGRMRWNVS